MSAGAVYDNRGLYGQDDEVGKSRYACAHRGCDRGASTGWVITFVNRKDEPREGYCSEHLADPIQDSRYGVR